MKLADVLEVVSRTDPGMVRSHNEDAVFGSAEHGLVILADGMGGYNAGEVASGMATTHLANSLTALVPGAKLQDIHRETGKRIAHKHLIDEVAAANHSIYQAAQSQAQFAGMGTTLVMAWFYDNLVTVAHIGDSRLYRLRGEEFQQITRDHSLLQEQIDSGMITPEEAKYSQNKNLVTRAVGVDPEVDAEIHDYDVEPGDIYLLCSDGLNDMVDDEEIALTLQALSANLELAADQLVQMANDNGGKDNISVILVKIRGDFGVPRGWLDSILAWFK